MLNWGLFGKSYSMSVIAGIVLIVVSGMLLQRSGGGLLDDRRSLLMALAAMVASAVYSLADAAAMQVAQPATFVFWTYLLVTLLLAAAALLGRDGEAGSVSAIARCWGRAHWRIIAASIVSYVSYYFILLAFQMKGDPALVVAVRQLSIPVSVILAALVLAEPRFLHRLGWAGVLAVGVVIVVAG